jgi:stage V sporulation protein SpoVS
MGCKASMSGVVAIGSGLLPLSVDAIAITGRSCLEESGN